MVRERPALMVRRYIALMLLLLCAIPAHGAATQPATKPAAFELSFATPDEARAAIVDESAEPYFKLLQPLEMAAKTGSPLPGGELAQQQETCRKRYQNAVRDFTPAEKEALNWYVSKLAAYTYPNYPLLAATPWKFIKVTSEIEGGNPFTRGQYICLSSFTTDDVVKEMRNSILGGSDWTAMGAYARVLLHEQMHVIQRSHRELFAKFYTNDWGFSHAALITPDPWLVEHQMLDPDGIDQLWVYPLKVGEGTRWIWPLSIIGDVGKSGAPRFADLTMVAVDLKPGEKDSFGIKAGPNNAPAMTPLMNVLGYTMKFSPSREVFHPNEASADLFAHVALVLDILPGMAPPVAGPALNKARDEYKPQHDAFMKLLSDKK